MEWAWVKGMNKGGGVLNSSFYVLIGDYVFPCDLECSQAEPTASRKS